VNGQGEVGARAHAGRIAHTHGKQLFLTLFTGRVQGEHGMYETFLDPIQYNFSKRLPTAAMFVYILMTY